MKQKYASTLTHTALALITGVTPSSLNKSRFTAGGVASAFVNGRADPAAAVKGNNDNPFRIFRRFIVTEFYSK